MAITGRFFSSVYAMRFVPKDQSCRKIKFYNEISKGVPTVLGAALNGVSFNIQSEMSSYQEHRS